MKIKRMMNIAILASGNGSNFEAIAKAYQAGRLRGIRVKLLLTDKKNAYVRKRAAKCKIKDIFLDPAKLNTRQDYDKELVRILNKEKVDFVVLAGFMRVLSSYFVRKFKNRILNIHPALLPAFKGTSAIARGYDYGVKLTGVTVHFVDERIDHGPIILQRAVAIEDKESLASLEKKIHRLEHKLYPQALKLLVDGRLQIYKRKVKILKSSRK
jgi:phosphoribosylglycinamide formyltransferase-1